MAKRKYGNLRQVMSAERAAARRWQREANGHLRAAEEARREARAYLKTCDAKERSKARKLLKDTEQLVREARERRAFFDGVAAGMMMMENAVSGRLIAAELDPFGRR